MGITTRRNDLREQIDEIINLYQSGLTAQKVGNEFNCSKRLILNLLKENGIERRIYPPKGRIPWNKGKRNPYWIGEKNPNWKGGITPLIVKIRRCFEYKQWVQRILKKDNYTCRFCNKRGGSKQADHYPKDFADIIADNKIKTFQQALDCKELWDLDNGRTLCIPCHRTTFKFKGNHNRILIFLLLLCR